MQENALTNQSATAHQAWENRWQSESGRADWLNPDPDVAAIVPLLRSRNCQSVLDLGCGVGRHACYLASEGFDVHAMDASPSGLGFAANQATEHGLEITCRQGLMTALPYDDASFDYVLSFNVIYHGDGEVVARSIAEIHRALKPGGLFQGTMLSKRNANYGIGVEVAPHTFVISDAGDGDKNHPHYYCKAGELVSLFEDFELLSLVDREHERPGSYHWHLVAERL